MGVRKIDTPATDAFGMAVDFDGHAWAFGWTTGNASVIDIDTEIPSLALADCEGNPCLHSPYVRGDATGLQRINAVEPVGRWSTVFEGCGAEPTSWRAASVDARTPAGTSVSVTVRTADDLAALRDAVRVRLGALPEDEALPEIGAALDAARVPSGALLEVEVLLTSSGDETPTLRRVEVTHACEGGVE